MARYLAGRAPSVPTMTYDPSFASWATDGGTSVKEVGVAVRFKLGMVDWNGGGASSRALNTLADCMRAARNSVGIDRGSQWKSFF